MPISSPAIAGRDRSSSEGKGVSEETCLKRPPLTPCLLCPVHLCGVSLACHWNQRSQCWELGFRQWWISCTSDGNKNLLGRRAAWVLLCSFGPFIALQRLQPAKKLLLCWPGACILLPNPHPFSSPFYLTTRNSFSLTQDRLKCVTR